MEIKSFIHILKIELLILLIYGTKIFQKEHVIIYFCFQLELPKKHAEIEATHKTSSADNFLFSMLLHSITFFYCTCMQQSHFLYTISLF